ncbi:50S ribosomal protein L11 methyltransferase [Paradesertivirga mongoliensis]|uniref:Ribosomal protein L11 methyltransferase n=1 Tax=Paradesertivirga mongoliensis TaxID=2100740 RepID=A0ABW4ZNA4_9SPHI|nr:50S ribosomal protein L11 methyltransferase [Pedobacter mongoliensis]
MNYFEVAFTINSEEEYQRDLLINALGEAGFDTFEETSAGFNAYIPADSFDENVFLHALNTYQDVFSFTWEKTEVPQKNWNEVWESNFEPLIIKDKCYVRATFHEPKVQYPLEIVVDPKMAFGTGHHQTTTMMMEFILEEDFAAKRILDMGAGTGILAILAAKRGAKNITAIDYDPVCYDSILENSRLNNTPFDEVLCGSKEIIPDKQYDIILANINRNILLDQMGKYAEVLVPGGQIYLSGFYEADLEILSPEMNKLKMLYVKHKTLDDWCAVKFLKQT